MMLYTCCWFLLFISCNVYQPYYKGFAIVLYALVVGFLVINCGKSTMHVSGMKSRFQRRSGLFLTDELFVSLFRTITLTFCVLRIYLFPLKEIRRRWCIPIPFCTASDCKSSWYCNLCASQGSQDFYLKIINACYGNSSHNEGGILCCC